MAIQWGSWEYAGGNGMRVGIDVSRTSVYYSSDSCTVTFAIYTENQYRYNNPNTELSINGTINWSNVTFNNDDGGSPVKRTTKSYTYTYDSNDYGSGTAKTVTLSASVSNTYNGVTPSKSVSYNIPKRPYAAPLPQTDVTATRVSDSSATVSWVRHESTGRPYDYQRIDRWDNVSNAYAIYDGNFSDTATSISVATAANRRYRFRTFANGAGWSDAAYSDYLQTTPASPSGCSVTKTGVTSVLIGWSNGASTTNGYTYDTLLEEQVDGGVWTEIATIPEGVTSFSRPDRAPGSVYAYRVRARSTVGATTYSDYSTSGTIQLQSPPAAPTVVSTVRTNDNSFTLTWTNNPNGEIAPYNDLTVQRWNSLTSTWETIASLAATATSLTDTGTVVNRRYQWRIAANNAAGTSDWAYFDTYQTRPDDPSEVAAKAAPGGALRATWINKVSYTAYSTVLRYYKNGTLQAGTITLAAGETSYTLNGVDLTATYIFEVKTLSTVGYASESAWVASPSVAAATVPNAPSGLAPSGTVIDTNFDQTLTWTHVPSTDGSDQTAFELEYSLDDGATWTATGGKTTSADSSFLLGGGEIVVVDRQEVTWRVRTWGVHADPSPWSSYANFLTSTTPVVTLNLPAGGTLTTSRLDVEWSFSDAEQSGQAFWEIELYNATNELIERQSGTGDVFATTMATVITDGDAYELRIRVQDQDELNSNWVTRSLTASFTPPAMPTLAADYSQESGVTILTLTPTASDGVTTLPVTGVDVQRRLLDLATGVFGPWETLAEQVTDSATLIDTTSPIANDGEYRVIAYSAAPSAKISEPQPPSANDDRWVYVSGGPNFEQVCRLMGNVALRSTTTRDRSLYQFAGRRKPVMFAGEARTRVIDVAGLLDGESSSPAEWESLIENCEVLMFRDPLGHRIFGSIPQVAIDHLGNDMYAISFTVTEVSFP